MSLLDLIREQQLIFLSIGLAVLPMLVAAGLFLVPRMRQMSARRAQRRAEQAEQRAQERSAQRSRRRARKGQRPQEEDDLFVPLAEPRPGASSRVQHQQTAEQCPADGEPETEQADNSVTVKQISAQPTVAQSDEGEQAEEERQAESEQPDKDKPSDEMQDLLSSVFADDEALALYAVLLEDTDDVDIAHLAELSDQIAEQLHRCFESPVLG